MIIQHPDGSYEVCPLTPAAARWLRTLLRRAAEARPGRSACQEGAAACAARLDQEASPCRSRG
jgi:hypothetical protein